MRMRKEIGIAIALAVLPLAAAAAEVDLASMAGMTCKGPFSSSVTNSKMTQGAIWLVFSSDGTPTAHLWRKWGKEALANPKPAARDSEYEDRGIVTISAKGGKLLYSATSMGTTFHTELTPTKPPSSFTTKFTGGQFGAEGTLECSK